MKRAVCLLVCCLCICFSWCCAFADDLDEAPESLDPAESSELEGDVSGSEEEEVDAALTLDLENLTINANTVVLQSIGDTDPEELPDEPSNEIGQYGYSIICNIPNVGNNQILLIPANYRDNYFAVDDDGYLYNVSSSTITCYVGEYSVRFASYSIPQTRHTNAQYNEQWIDSHVTYLSSSDVSVKGANTLWWSDMGYPLIIIGMLGVVVICQFIRH